MDDYAHLNRAADRRDRTADERDRAGDQRDDGALVEKMNNDSYADIVERLFLEFDGQRTLSFIVGVVHKCDAELQGGAGHGEALERSARERLSVV